MNRRGTARRGAARRGKAGPGEARQGTAMQGQSGGRSNLLLDYIGAGRGPAGQGVAGLGKAGQGKARGFMTDRQFDKRLAALEKQVALNVHSIKEIMGAVTSLAGTFTALVGLLSMVKKPPPDDMGIKVGLN